MRCRLTPRRRTSWYFQARSPKCRWPFLSPRRWWGRTLLLRRTSRQEEKRLRKVREAKAFSTRPPNVSTVCNTLYTPQSTHPLTAYSLGWKDLKFRRMPGGTLTKPTFKQKWFADFCFLTPKKNLTHPFICPNVFIYPIFCSYIRPPIPSFLFHNMGTKKPGSPTFLCH